MSNATLPSPAEPPATPPVAAPASLAELRAELDRLDDALHATLMRRAEVVAAVGSLGVKRATALRPGREAAIIRRLLAAHSGGLPRQAVVRLWRELLAATTAMQGRFAVAVCDAEPALATVAIAREHFGALTPLGHHRTPAQAIRQVSEGRAAVAVLPMPAQDEPDQAAWWTALLHQDVPRLHIVARLPFWAPRPEGTPQAQALVVSAADPDPSGADRSLLGLEIAAGISRARLGTALGAAGFAARDVILRRYPGAAAAQALVEVEGFVAADDRRLAAANGLIPAPVLLGAYAVPIEETSA
ncbi:MAG TPA: chorismate mutase [Acetobacteraceae bacterium]|jgi:chorismate mutase|nr:chorismate mutase [Acetobacteraceae bacterium]